MVEEHQATIQVHNLTKKFGDFTAVNNISFQVHRGEIFGFLGPNGSGKTTTIRMLLGLLKPSLGEAQVLNVNASKQPHLIRPKVGYMSQQFTLYNDLTVLQNLNFYGRAYGLDNKQLQTRINDVLEMAGLVGREHTRTKELSGGWRQRLALGASILHQPELVFLDEPTAGVDPVSRRAFWDLLYQLIKDGVTIFVTTHYMDEAEHCHRLAFIQYGQLIAIGTPQSIKADTFEGDLFELNCDQPALALNLLEDIKKNPNSEIKDIGLYGALIHILFNKNYQTKQIKSIQKQLLNSGLKQVDIQSIQPTLEDVFITSMRSAQTLNHGVNYE